MRAGDVLLLESRDLTGCAIRLAQRLGGKGAAARFTHAALVVDAGGGLIEARAAGIRRASLAGYAGRPTTIAAVAMTDADRAEVVAFAEARLAAADRYDFLTILGLGLMLLTRGRLVLGLDGAEVCSGLVASALARANLCGDRDPRAYTPADLAIALGVAS